MQRLALRLPLVRTLGRRVWFGPRPHAAEVDFDTATGVDVVAIITSFPWHPATVPDNLLRQHRGESSYVVGRCRNVVVARGELRWGDHHAASVRERYPGVPEMNGLDVLRALQGRGIGARLVGYLALLAHQRGHRRVGLGVVDDNVPAARLYRRMGFAGPVGFVDEYHIAQPDGSVRHFADPATFLVADTADLIGFYCG